MRWGDTAVPGSGPQVMPHHTELRWSCRAVLRFSRCSAHVLPHVPTLSSPFLCPMWILQCQHGGSATC